MITVTILTKNSEKYLDEVLCALRCFNEVLIFDNGSTDNTLTIAEKYPNVRIEKGPFKGFGKTHNHASWLAHNDWILSIDSDEVITPSLCEEIKGLQLDDSFVYSIPRHNEFNGKFIRWCGWYPDRVYRLYNRKKTQFTEAEVHEQVIIENMTHIALKGALKHYSYDTISDFLTKMQFYSTLFATQYQGKKKSSPCKAVLHGVGAFLKSYLIKRGILGGYEGFVISAYNGHTAFYKYLKLYEANTRIKK